MENLVTDAPFFDGRDPVQTAADIVEQKGFSRNSSEDIYMETEYILRKADDIINRPYREALHRYQSELDEWRYRLTMMGLVFGASVGVASDFVLGFHTFVKNGEITTLNLMEGAGILLLLTAVGTGIGEIAARSIAKSRSK